MSKIVKQKIIKTKNKISGKFYLKDKSITSFEITKDYGWKQWGNHNENLWVTVPILEQLEKELHNL